MEGDVANVTSDHDGKFQHHEVSRQSPSSRWREGGEGGQRQRQEEHELELGRCHENAQPDWMISDASRLLPRAGTLTAKYQKTRHACPRTSRLERDAKGKEWHAFSSVKMWTALQVRSNNKSAEPLGPHNEKGAVDNAAESGGGGSEQALEGKTSSSSSSSSSSSCAGHGKQDQKLAPGEAQEGSRRGENEGVVRGAEQKRTAQSGECGSGGRRGCEEGVASPVSHAHSHSYLSAADTARGDHDSHKAQASSPEEACDWAPRRLSFEGAVACRGPPVSDMHEELMKTPRLARLVEGMRGQFRILRKLGQGGFANVYEAWDTESQRYVALKVFNPCQDHLSCRTEAVHLRTYGGEQHNIIFTVECPPTAPRGGFLASGDVQVLCLPYFEHDEPHTFIPEGLATHECRTYLRGLFVALARLHEDGVLHRDIKPGNYLYNRKEGRCLLIDFGLAEKRSKNDRSSSRRRDSSLSHANQGPRGGSGNNNNNNNNNNSNSNSSSVVLSAVPDTSLLKRKREREIPDAVRDGRGGGMRAPQSRVTPSQGHQKLAGIGGGGEQGWQQSGGGGGSSRRVGQGGASSAAAKAVAAGGGSKKKEPRANQAGTKGWRAPEVLMQSQKQTTAIDIWSVGVVMLSLLSRKYPFFECADNPTNLLQIRHMRMLVSSMDRVRGGGQGGTDSYQDKMKVLERELNLVVSMGDVIDSFEAEARKHGHTWKTFLEGQCRVCPKSGCTHLDKMGLDEDHPIWDLLDQCLDLDPRTRITAKDALLHPFFAEAGR